MTGLPNRLQQRVTLEGAAWLMACLLIFWAPLPGEQRLPGFILFGLGFWLRIRRPETCARLPGVSLLGKVILLLILAALASLPTSAAPEETVKVVIALALSYWMALALLAGLSSRPMRLFLLSIGMTFALWAIDSLTQWRLGVDLFGVPLYETRVTGPFPNLRMSVILGICMPLLLFPMSRRWPIAAVLAWGLLTFIVGMSGARASLVFALLAGLGLLFQLPRWHYRLALIGACVGFVGLAALQSPQLMQRLVADGHAPVNPGLARMHGGEWRLQADAFLSGRLTIWTTGWNMFRDRPLTGVGAAAFDVAYDRYSPQADDPFRSDGPQPISHAHQLYLSMAAEAGLVGLLALAALITLTIRWYRALPEAGKKRAFPFAYSLFVAFFPLNSQLSVFIGWWYLTLLLIFCAMLVAGEGSKEDDTRE